MNSIASLILPGATQVRIYSEKILKGIPKEIFARKPVIADSLVNTNHPAFLAGHLSLYPARIFKLLGIDNKTIIPPEKYYALFAIGSTCEDDPDSKIYPTKDELVSNLLSWTDTVLTTIPEIEDRAFFADNTEERSKERFPNIGSFIIYLLTAHANVHLGQISTWRRCFGLGPV